MKHLNHSSFGQPSITLVEHEIEEVDCIDILEDLYCQERENDDDLLIDEKPLDFN